MKTDLKKWFKKRPLWLQEAAKRIIEKGKLEDKDYIDLYECCLNEAKNQLEEQDVDIPIDRLLTHGNSEGAVKLKSIGNIKGINALSPKKPLNFGDKNLSIIYGLNGAGKSGYVRILKQICGVKTNLPLLSNVYNSFESERKCTIEYQTRSEPLKAKEWRVIEEPVSDLICVNIFDSECALSYVTNENEVTYEPQVLLFFSDLVGICEKLSSRINFEINRKSSKKPPLPLEYKTTKGGRWYNEDLSENTTEQCLDKYCSWTKDSEKELSKIQRRLSQEDPGKKATKTREKNRYTKELINEAISLLESFSDEKCIEINQLKAEYVTAKKTAKAAADQTFKNASLDGVGSEIWRRLWQYAKDYSEKEAYKEQSFPVISDDALCVLCHQKLSKDAKERFVSFNNFIKGEAQRAVENAQKSLENIAQSLPSIPDQQMLETKIVATGMQLDNTQIKTLYVELRKRKNQLDDPNIQPNLIPLPSIKEWKNKAEEIIKEREHSAKQYDEDSRELNRDNLLVKQKELKTREWLSQQISSIREEIKKLQNIKILNSTEKLTNTKALSIKKSELSEKLITQDFVNRFNIELKALEANRIKVDIFKSRTEKGKALYQVRLKDANSRSVKAVDILSEGEIRIVALSAFLADVTGGKHSVPFIFDDPISSLDQNFEKAVAQRLIRLSKERQVIVFTHRPSTLGLLEEYAKKNDIEPHTVCIKEEAWGTGEPGDTPLFMQKPPKALNTLIEKLPQAKKLLKTQGRDFYDKEAKNICSDFRKIIENVIESTLLSGIVKRYRRQIHSQEIKKLAKIKDKDCKFIDDLMTEYSELLHSAPDETPVNFPDPERLEEDFESLKKWIKEFRNRDVS